MALGYFLIFVARVIDMSFATIRILLVVRGQRLQAAALGFFEVIVYILALNSVVQHLNNPFNLLAYALGFAAGNYVGSYVEEKLAMGHVTLQVIPKGNSANLAAQLRSAGYGVTVIDGYGKEGLRQLLIILVERKKLSTIMRFIDELDHDSFVTVMETKSIQGGFLGLKAK